VGFIPCQQLKEPPLTFYHVWKNSIDIVILTRATIIEIGAHSWNFAYSFMVVFMMDAQTGVKTPNKTTVHGAQTHLVAWFSELRHSERAIFNKKVRNALLRHLISVRSAAVTRKQSAPLFVSVAAHLFWCISIIFYLRHSTSISHFSPNHRPIINCLDL
jgi:hypothetical protein